MYSLNQIDNNPAALISHGSQAYQALQTHAATLDFAAGTQAKFAGILGTLLGDTFDGLGLPGLLGDYNSACLAAVEAINEKNVAEAQGKAFLEKAIDNLKAYYGRTWNTRWLAAGFTSGTLKVGRDPYKMLSEMHAHLLAFPAHENPAQGITAVAAKDRVTALVAARQKVTVANRTRKEMAAARKSALGGLSKNLTGLRGNLALVLPRDDFRWYDFGFKRPIDGKLPVMVAGLEVMPAAAGEVRLQWLPSTRAVNYRVTVMQPDGEVLSSTLTAETLAIIGGLPHGIELTCQVTALNKAGETRPAEAVITLA